MDLILDSLKFVANSAVDVLPIVIFLFAFQVLVIGGRMPNVRQILVGFVFVIVGLGLFLEGLEQALFPPQQWESWNNSFEIWIKDVLHEDDWTATRDQYHKGFAAHVDRVYSTD